MATENIKVFTIRVDTKTGKMAVDDLTNGFVKQETAVKRLNEEIEKNTKELGKMVDKSGLAGAAVVEIGRTISDANYGFTAMANNISQLGTLFTTLIATTGGLRQAVQALIKAFRGPLGIIVGVQILVAVLEFFAKKQKEAAEATRYLDTQIQAQTSAIESLIQRLEDANLLEEERLNILSSLSQVNKDLEVILSDRTKTEDELLESLRNYLRIEKLRNEADAIGNALKEETLANDDERIRLQKEINKLQQTEQRLLSDPEPLRTSAKGQILLLEVRREMEALQVQLNTLNEERNVIEQDYIFILNKLNKEEGKTLAAAPRTIEFYNQQIKRLEEVRDNTATTASQYKIYSDAIEEVKKKIKEITGEEEKQGKKRKGFTAQRLSFDKEILASEQALTKNTIKGREQQLRAESQYQMDLAQIKFEEFAQRQKDRVAAIEDPKLRAEAEKKAAESIKEAEISLSEFKIQKMSETDARIDILRINNLQKARQAQQDIMNQEAEDILSFNAQMATNDLDRIMYQRQLEDEQHKNKIKNIEDEITARKIAGESYVDLQEQITSEVARNERAKTRLVKEEEDAKLNIINFATNAAIAIAGKGSALGKSIAIAMAIINTRKAITEALGDEEVPGFFRILHATAIGAFGFKQVQDIINTKLPVKDTSGTGGAAGSTTIETAAPDFNVVGIGQASQLGQVIGSQFGQPIRAYVVSNDVNTGQALERSITGNAKLD